jgi:OCT family organic cation transporter-like MFS transporter 4/5
MVYYGLILNSENLSGDLHLIFFIMSLVGIPDVMLTLFLLTRVGRRPLNTGTRVIGGLACVSTIFTVVYGGSCEYYTGFCISITRLTEVTSEIFKQVSKIKVK